MTYLFPLVDRQLDKMEEAGLLKMPYSEPLFQFKFPE